MKLYRSSKNNTVGHVDPAQHPRWARRALERAREIETRYFLEHPEATEMRRRTIHGECFPEPTLGGEVIVKRFGIHVMRLYPDQPEAN